MLIVSGELCGRVCCCCVRYEVCVCVCGEGGGSRLDRAVSALTPWRLLLQNSPPSVPCAPLPVLLSLHIL